ncbi:three component ABC system middle component [Pontibacter pudoricolor]|uniref:three component ABC system middle component n=1 Tax=Pontibacter pudoricolor TaxID=2694930 RepID=UPI001391C63E|nr:three component ABC system middle component [Pontibacter pudoricolor]
MIQWKERPVEVANLLNPAFCALLLRQAALGYQKQIEQGIDLPLLFLVLPLVLHKTTRESLPKTSVTRLHVWVQQHQEVRVGLTQRTNALQPYTRESIIYAMQRNALSITTEGGIIAPKMKKSNVDSLVDTEASQCLDKALFLGRWFASAGSTVSVMSMFGLRI